MKDHPNLFSFSFFKKFPVHPGATQVWRQHHRHTDRQLPRQIAKNLVHCAIHSSTSSSKRLPLTSKSSSWISLSKRFALSCEEKVLFVNKTQILMYANEAYNEPRVLCINTNRPRLLWRGRKMVGVAVVVAREERGKISERSSKAAREAPRPAVFIRSFSESRILFIVFIHSSLSLPTIVCFFHIYGFYSFTLKSRICREIFFLKCCFTWCEKSTASHANIVRSSRNCQLVEPS